MTRRTRYFVLGSFGLLALGLSVGLAAYYGGIRGVARQSGPDELAMVPEDAAVVAYANVSQLMASQFRRQVREVGPSMSGDGHDRLRSTVGIDVEKDIDYVVACLLPAAAGDRAGDHSGYVVARGRFDAARIGAYMREKGGVEERYRGRLLLVRPVEASRADGSPRSGALAVTFPEPGVAALGTDRALRRAIDVVAGAVPPVTANREMMKMVRGVDSGNAWVVGRIEALSSQAHLPSDVQRQLPQLTWFSASGHVDGGVSGSLTVQARDQEAAANLQQVVAGLVALARMQAASRPELNALLQSVTLSGNAADNTVSVSFVLPPAAIEALKAAGAGKRDSR
jgi:hypothetical protein